MIIVHNNEAGGKTIKKHFLLVLVPCLKDKVHFPLIDIFGFVGGYFLLNEKLSKKFNGIVNEGHNFECLSKRPYPGMFINISFLEGCSVATAFKNHIPKFKVNQIVYIIIPKMEFFQKIGEIISGLSEIEKAKKYRFVLVTADKPTLEAISQMIN